jgi:DNA invertase Pin-like site-specific DNA recombinase
MTKTIGYIRVSTDKQADKGVSLEAQQEKLKAYATLYDLELVEIIVDAGESAKSLNRPGLTRALSMLGKEADALLVVKLDRLTRSVADLGKLLDSHFKTSSLLSVSEQIDTRTAAGRLVLNVLASVSQWEREAIGERTSVAMRHKQSKGEYIGGKVPYGFRLVDGELIKHESEQRVMSAVKEFRKAGLSYRAIIQELEARGFKSRSGKTFSPMQVKRIAA